MAGFPHRHLLAIDGLTAEEIEALLDEAEPWIAFNRSPRRRDERLAGLTQINAFFENSTRTLLSFEIAGKRLGAQVVNVAVAQSSMSKGETLRDTALTIGAMRPDAIVVRHAEMAAVEEIAGLVDCAVINAGAGTAEHPTQALLDALTIRRRLGGIAGRTVAICGDVLHSRVARSNIALLTRLGAAVRVIGPEELLPAADALPGVARHVDMDEGLAGADVVMMLRIQRERIDDTLLGQSSLFGDPRAFADRYRLTRARLALAAAEAFVMHPGPMNRGVEIDDDVADDPDRSAILQQVELGVAVRMACLDVLTRGRRD